uniref:Putative secreted protein n=1 Tax=Ixodes ricinus TaxID=34613 RepID=A0A6B0U4F2_IXORI
MPQHGSCSLLLPLIPAMVASRAPRKDKTLQPSRTMSGQSAERGSMHSEKRTHTLCRMDPTPDGTGSASGDYVREPPWYLNALQCTLGTSND